VITTITANAYDLLFTFICNL